MSSHTLHLDESAFIDAFVLREKRDRWRTLLAHAKGRPKILNRLNHHHPDHLDLRHAIEIVTRNSRAIVDTLQKLGAGPTAHVIAGSDEFEGRDIPFTEALHHFVSYPFAVIVSCVPGRLAAFHAEWPTSFFVLRRS